MFGEGMGSDANITRDVLLLPPPWCVRRHRRMNQAHCHGRRSEPALQPNQVSPPISPASASAHLMWRHHPHPHQRRSHTASQPMYRCCWIKHTRVAWPRLLQRNHPPLPHFTTLMWTRRKTQRLLAHLHSGLAGIICRTLPHAVNAATSLAPVARDGMRRRDAIPIRTAITIDGARLICSVDVQELHRRTLVSCAT
jgi:hypothetical protein